MLVASKDVAWAKSIRLANLTTLNLMPIKDPIIKELLQSIVRLNVDAIESMLIITIPNFFY
jgi:hypothetical protein